jgi:hypothetical protein
MGWEGEKPRSLEPGTRKLNGLALDTFPGGGKKELGIARDA